MILEIFNHALWLLRSFFHSLPLHCKGAEQKAIAIQVHFCSLLVLWTNNYFSQSRINPIMNLQYTNL